MYPDDHPRTRLVKDVVSSLSEQVHKLDHLPSHLRSIEWKVTVVESKTINAMAAPGGRIIVFAGVAMLVPAICHPESYLASLTSSVTVAYPGHVLQCCDKGWLQLNRSCVAIQLLPPNLYLPSTFHHVTLRCPPAACDFARVS